MSEGAAREVYEREVIPGPGRPIFEVTLGKLSGATPEKLQMASGRPFRHFGFLLPARARIASKRFRSDAIGSWRSVVAVADDVAVNVPHESRTGRTGELRPIRVI